jgi:HD-like signal output (HDOD) protein
MEEHPVIEKLLHHLNSGAGFAGMGSSIQTMSSMDDDDIGIGEITEAILRDAALTAKLLRLANSSNRASRNVATIDQAISLIGLNTVKNVTMSLAMLNSMSSGPQSGQLHAEIAAAYFCGALAAQITRVNGARYNAQEAQVCGLMQNLGRMMAIYYLYDEIEKSQILQAEENLSQDDAVAQTIGVTFAEIGAAIAHKWNLPDTLQSTLNPVTPKSSPRAAANAHEWNQAVALFCRRITDTMFRAPENQEKALVAQDIQFFRTILLLKDDEIQTWIKNVWDDTAAMLPSIGFPISLEEARTVLRKASERVLDNLSSQDSLTSNAAADGGKTPIEIIQQMLRMIHNECQFDLTLLCLPNGSTGLVAIAGLGRKANQTTSIFRCQGQKPDIFRLIAAKKVDMYVADTQAASFKQFIPDWYPANVGAGSFLLMSLVHDGQLVGMVYGDYTTARGVAPEVASQEKVKGWRAMLAQALMMNKKPAA